MKMTSAMHGLRQKLPKTKRGSINVCNIPLTLRQAVQTDAQRNHRTMAAQVVHVLSTHYANDGQHTNGK